MAEVLQLTGERRRRRQILSAQGGALEASPRLRRFLVIHDGGGMLAAPAAFDDPEYQTLLQRAQDQGIRLREPEIASLDQIAAAYARVVDVAEFATQARQSFLAIVERGARQRASDAMIVRNGDEAAVRYRVDGQMRDDRSLDAERATAISNSGFHFCSAGDSLASPTRPVRASITSADSLPKGVSGVRLQYAPTAQGFVLILRLVYAAREIQCRTLEEAGYSKERAAVIRAAVQASTGVFLVAGPTEHGKSTTLNLAIEEFARCFAQPPNVVAVEDPPETLHLPYVHAFSVNTSIESEESAFESALMAALRLAPDGIKIGELRDTVSAQTAYRAAGSGALVFSTLHAPFATDTPFRLMDLGLERHHAFDPLNVLWLAQRLVPTACPGCAVPTAMAKVPAHCALLDAARQLDLRLGKACFTGKGCEACSGTGYAGRYLTSEYVAPTSDLLEIGLADSATRQSFRRAWLRRGGWPMTADAFSQVRRGRVPLEAFVRSVATLESLSFDAAHMGPSP